MQSEWAELFIRYNHFWGGEPTEAQLGMIYTRKPRPPFREVEHADGTVQKARCCCLVFWGVGWVLVWPDGLVSGRCFVA